LKTENVIGSCSVEESEARALTDAQRPNVPVTNMFRSRRAASAQLKIAAAAAATAA